RLNRYYVVLNSLHHCIAARKKTLFRGAEGDNAPTVGPQDLLHFYCPIRSPILEKPIPTSPSDIAVRLPISQQSSNDMSGEVTGNLYAKPRIAWHFPSPHSVATGNCQV
ncbi:MAG: hypothetical protein ACI9HK_001367, partial [Pirellulaceae bacterium]